MRQKSNQRCFQPLVCLHIATSLEAAWQQVLLPWFEKETPAVFAEDAPVAVVTPFRSHAYILRRKLFARGISLLGVRFLAPAELREFLESAGNVSVPLREHLRLLLSSAAEECAADFEAEGKLDAFHIATAVARESDGLLRAIDSVTGAGATFTEFALPPLAKIAKRFETILEACGCTLLSQADRLSVERAPAGTPRFSKLLITGFDAMHWPLWPLLRAAVLAANNSIVHLREPRPEGGEADRIWVATWEEHFGAAQRVATSAEELEPRFVHLLTKPETQSEIAARQKEPLQNVHFILSHDTTEQAQATVTLAVGFLADPSCEEVAVLLPGAGALARLVAGEFEKLDIPHNDGIAHPMRGAFDTEEWRAWVELQERPQLGPLLRFLVHSTTAMAGFAPLPLWKVQNTLRRACGDILINAVDVLREYCRSKDNQSDYHKIGGGLDAIRFLPQRATFKKFVATANEIFRAFKWTERAAELDRLARDWSKGFTQTIAREHFIRWLTEIFSESSISRDPCGDHPYARVQLLRYDEAEFGSWSHVICAGLNEGVWPARHDESPFLPDNTIAVINGRNTRDSERFGVGQQIVREGTTFCLDSVQLRTLALRQLLNVIESATEAIAVAAERYTESPREQAVNPSELFARLYFAARGEALSQTVIAGIHNLTTDWLAQTDLFEPARTNIGVRQTETAYLARRRPDMEFGEYEFGFCKGSPPLQQISLSATEIANLLQRPALVWMKIFLGVEAEDLDLSSWNLATGQWVHRWLASIGAPRENRFLPLPSPDEILRRVPAAADYFRAEVLAILKACGRTREPDWWTSGWRNARHLAEQFAKQVAANADSRRVATEWQLGSPHVIRLGPDDELRVRGRLDLILVDREDANHAWIIDYKTGEADPLKSKPEKFRKQLTSGDGVQICIYALALRQDFNHIDASLLTRHAILQPQVSLVDIVAANELWKEIARMERTGIFGMLGEIRSEFTFTGTYPLATLSIDKYLLRDKWERTHPAFAKQEDK